MVGDIDVTPINLFGGIPDEDLNGETIESTWLPPDSSSYVYANHRGTWECTAYTDDSR